MNIEEAREIIEKENANPSWHGIRIAEYRYAKYFLEGYEAGRREALESEAVKGLEKALKNIKRDLEICEWRCFHCDAPIEMKDKDIYDYCKEGLTSFEQFKQEGKS